jgi:peptide/nickel transport system ATP-binding protein
MDVLRVQDLKCFYVVESQGQQREVKAVNGVSLNVKKNQVLGIAGESGCGKTTFLKSLLGLVRPPLRCLGGKVEYIGNGKATDIMSLSKHQHKELMWEHISYVPQGSLSVLNPVRRIGDTFESFIGAHMEPSTTKHQYEELVCSHLEALGLPEDTLRAYPHQLSGGMRQRVTIALATILKPQLILADEPSTALDVVVQRGVIQLLKDIQEEQQNTIILVTHDMAIHANICDRIAIMYAGKIIEEAGVDEVFNNPRHPYTQYLIGSLPRIGDKAHRISAPGSPPSLSDLPQGCSFHPRCPEATDDCRKEEPMLTGIGGDHKVACLSLTRGDFNADQAQVALDQ